MTAWADYGLKTLALYQVFALLIGGALGLAGLAFLSRKRVGASVPLFLLGYLIVILFAPLYFVGPLTIVILPGCAILLLLRYRYARYTAVAILLVIGLVIPFQRSTLFWSTVYSEDASYSARFPATWSTWSKSEGVSGFGPEKTRFTLGLSAPREVQRMELEMLPIASMDGKNRQTLLREMAADTRDDKERLAEPVVIEESELLGNPMSLALVRAVCETYDPMDGRVRMHCYRLFAVAEIPQGFLTASGVTSYGKSDAGKLQRIVESFRFVPESEQIRVKERRVKEFARLLKKGGDVHHYLAASRLLNVETIPILLEALENGNLNVREGVCRVVAHRGRKDESLHAALTQAAEDLNDAALRSEVRTALGYPAPADPERIATLLAELDELPGEKSPTNRVASPRLKKKIDKTRNTLNALGDMQSGAREAVPKILWVAQNEVNQNTRTDALRTLGKIGPGATEAIPALLEMLTNPQHPHAGRYVADCLAKIGDASPEVIDALFRVCGPFYNREDQAVEAIATLAPKNIDYILPILIKIVVADERTAGNHAVKGLQNIGPAAAPAVPELIAILKQGTRVYGRHDAAIKALGAIGPAAEAALPAIERYLEVDSKAKRKAAREAINAITTKAVPNPQEEKD